MNRSAAGHRKSVPRMFGSSLAQIFSAPDYDCRLEGSYEKPEFAVTRLRSGPRPLEKAPAYPADDALLVCVALTPTAVGRWRARYNGREVGVTRAIPLGTMAQETKLCASDPREKVRQFPTTPGVYLMKDGAGRVIYVGKAVNLRSRAGSYFTKAAGSDRRTADLVRVIEDIDRAVTAARTAAEQYSSRMRTIPDCTTRPSDCSASRIFRA